MNYFKKYTSAKIIEQFVKFGIVGFSNTFISYFIIVGCLYLFSIFDIRYDYILANFISFIISVGWSYYWNRRYVFNVKSNNKKQEILRIVKTYFSYFLSGIIITNICSLILIEQLFISKYVSPIFVLGITVPINFILIKYWAIK